MSPEERKRKIRVLIAKVGLDGHYRGALVLSKMLRDAGMEVIYTGLFQTPEKVVQTAIEEDVDVIGLSFLSGEHLAHTSKVMRLLKERGIEDLPVLVGGVLPKDDVYELEEMGVNNVFRADTPVKDIVDYILNIRELCKTP